MLGWRKSLPWNRRFQNLGIIHAFESHYSNTKMKFLKFSSDKMTSCNNNDQTWLTGTLTDLLDPFGSMLIKNRGVQSFTLIQTRKSNAVHKFHICTGL